MCRTAIFVLLTLCSVWSSVTAAQSTSSIVLERAAEVRALSAEAAAEGRPVRMRGNLVLVTLPGNAMVIIDRGEGIYVELPRVIDGDFQLGDELEIVGVSDAGDFAPIVRASQVTRLGPGKLPLARVSSVPELNAGGFDAAWIELRGIVRSCVRTPADRLPVSRANASLPVRTTPGRESWLVTFAQGDDKMIVQISGAVSPADLVDAEVRMKAVVFNVHNANRQFVRANLQVPDPSMIEIVVPPPADPFARPMQRLGEVMRFSRDGFSGHRVHVRGVVIGHKDGHTLWLREGDRGMRIASAQQGNLQPGDEVDVAGFPDHGSYTPSLSDAVFRKVATGPVPTPQMLNSADEISRHDANLVQIHAKLKEVRTTSEGQTLILDWNGREVVARFTSTIEPEVLDRWEPGSTLRVAGICVVGQTDFLRPTGLWMAEDLQLWLRSEGDVRVLVPAPWLSPRRTMVIVLLVAFLALLALVVVAVVARRQIVQREEARKLAEVEFSAMLAERNRLARDIHDTLAQDLNAVSMQLELAKNASKTGVVETVVPYLAAAHQIVRKTLAEARESIWNMRSHILERNDLAGALASVGEQLSAGVGCVVKVNIQGTLRRLAPMLENNLLRVGQEAISNALKHARANTIEVDLQFEEHVVRLTVTDDGVGFDPAAAAVGSSSHFGLSGMRERVAQMNGRFSVGPGPTGGTRVEASVDTPA